MHGDPETPQDACEILMDDGAEREIERCKDLKGISNKSGEMILTLPGAQRLETPSAPGFAAVVAFVLRGILPRLITKVTICFKYLELLGMAAVDFQA